MTGSPLYTQGLAQVFCKQLLHEGGVHTKVGLLVNPVAQETHYSAQKRNLEGSKPEPERITGQPWAKGLRSYQPLKYIPSLKDSTSLTCQPRYGQVTCFKQWNEKVERNATHLFWAEVLRAMLSFAHCTSSRQRLFHQAQSQTEETWTKPQLTHGGHTVWAENKLMSSAPEIWSCSYVNTRRGRQNSKNAIFRFPSTDYSFKLQSRNCYERILQM